MIAIAAGTNGLKCLPKHGGARDNKFGHPSANWPLRTLLSFRDRTPSALTTAPLRSSVQKKKLEHLYITHLPRLLMWISLENFYHTSVDPVCLTLKVARMLEPLAIPTIHIVFILKRELM
jgi:hypothetical protein